MKRQTGITLETHVKRVVYYQDGGSFGGMEMVILLLMRFLDRSRYEPLVLIPGYTDQERGSPPEFIDAVQNAGLLLLRPPHPGDLHGISYVRGVAGYWKLLRNAKADLVHIHTCHPTAAQHVTLAAALAGLPVVRTEHLPPDGRLSRSDALRLNVLDRLTYKVITVSDTNRDDQLRFIKRDPSKLYRSYNGIDLDRFRVTQSIADAKRTLGFNPSRILIGNVARLADQKGQKYLIEAAAQLLPTAPQVDIVFVGTGPDEQALRQQSQQLGIADHVYFAGYQSEPRAYIEAMDIAAMPSLFEGFSISMLEFMVMGKPLIVSDHPSMIEAVHHEKTGLVVPARSSKQLAEAILRLVRNPNYATELGQAAAHYARKEFSIQRQIADTMSLYDTVLGIH